MKDINAGETWQDADRVHELRVMGVSLNSEIESLVEFVWTKQYGACVRLVVLCVTLASFVELITRFHLKRIEVVDKTTMFYDSTAVLVDKAIKEYEDKLTLLKQTRESMRQTLIKDRADAAVVGLDLDEVGQLINAIREHLRQE